MSVKAKVVVVFPVYNGAATLRSSLQSLADQSFCDFRAIILENRSTDSSVEIARSFCEKDDRFSLIINDKHVDVLENFAMAVRLGADQGEYFCLRACDDHSSNDFLEELVRALDDNPGKLVATCNTRSLGPRGERFKRPNKDVLGFKDKYAQGHVPRNLTFPAEWIYGLYRANAKEMLMARWFELGNPWCFASYVVAEFVVLDLLIYVDGPTYDFTEGSGSDKRYGAKSFKQRLGQRLKYTFGCYQLHHKLPTVSLFTRMKLFRMCWNDARRKTRYKLLWIF